MKIYVNNVDNVERKLRLRKKIKFVRLIPLFCERRLREVVKKIPKEYDPETLKKFEEDTGIVLKYFVYEHSYDGREHTKLGPNPHPDFRVTGGSMSLEEFLSYELKDYDILVEINDKKLYIKD